MKKILILLLLALAMPTASQAQDARQRATSTIIADALAQFPVEKPDTYNQLMAELASTGAKGIEDIALMLTPAAKGQNAQIEYALYGLTAYSVEPGHENVRKNVRTALKNALNKTTDNENRAFLLTLLQNCATAEDAPTFMAYLQDSYLQEWAINGLIATPSTEDVILGLVNTEAAPRTVLAKAAAKKGIKEAEPIVLQWAQEAPAAEKKDFYRSLALIGSEKSVKVLANAAKAQNYAWEANAATEAYTDLLNNMAENGNQKAAAKNAKKLLKATDKSNVRAAALKAIFAAEGVKALPYAVKAMKDADRQYRVNALRLAEPYANAETYAALNKMLVDKKVSAEVKADIVNWYADTNNASQVDNVLNLTLLGDKELSQAAIRAMGILGGDNALDALIAQLAGENAEDASNALAHFNGKVNPGIVRALNSDNVATQTAALKIASLRHMTEASSKILELAKSSNANVSKAAAEALSGVAEPNDFSAIAALAEKANTDILPSLQSAMKKALRNRTAEDQYNTVLPYVNKAASPAVYYPVLAQAGTDKAIEELLKGYNGTNKAQAFNALLTVNNPAMINQLFNIAQNDKANADKALQRYARLVANSNYNPGRKSQAYVKALALNPSDATANTLISNLAKTNTYQAFTTAAEYLDKPANALTAAEAVRSIASRNIGAFDSSTMRNALNKAIEVFKADGSADSGYAVDDINGILSKISAEPSPEYKLSAEEVAQGFELLFDGHTLENWEGNTVDYIPVDGNIRVSAQYGSGGNLYTKKEYSDFIFRFEFCFEAPGVNNGIGIRTEIGKDAAYHGMEIQVLDHDAPIYKGLREYQVHGSVYGIIPAKRITHRPLGEWGEEEIRIVGDEITVTVNGEVIVKGNIRKACKGHNVDPDGSNRNPYTVDHLNHPGLFNKSGRIAFCGHGPGVKFRNIRIKDLSKSAKR